MNWGGYPKYPNRLASKLLGTFIMKKIATIFAGVLATAVAPAYAVMDITAAETAMGEVSAAVPLIGALFLGVLGLMAAWKLARGLFA